MTQEAKREAQVQVLTAVCVQRRCLSSHRSQQKLLSWMVHGE